MGVLSTLNSLPDVLEEFKRLLELARGQKGVKAHVKAILKLLLARKIIFKQLVHSSFIICSRRNRNGFGFSVRDVQDLMTMIWEAGYDENEIDGILIEIGHDSQDDVVKFNSDIVRHSMGYVAQVQPHLAKFETVAASHTNQVFRAILDGCKHSNPEFTTDGHIDRAKIIAKYPDMEKGLDVPRMSAGCFTFSVKHIVTRKQYT